MVSENFRGAILMLVSMVFFAVEDMFIKLLSQGLHFSQVLAIVGGLGFLTFWALLRIEGHRFLTADLKQPLLLLRTLGEAIGSVGVVVGLALTELASTSAIIQALPLAVVLGAALFLGEPVGWRRWTAIAVGFFGVLLIVRPGLAGFQPVSVVVLIGVLGLAMRDIATRRIPQHIPSNQVAALAFLAVLLAALGLAVVTGQGFLMLNGPQILLSLGCMVVGVAGYATLVTATRVAEASALAPYRYARLIFALGIAYVVFGERPDALTLTGAAIVVASGCYTMWRETQLRRRALRAAGFTLPRG